MRKGRQRTAVRIGKVAADASTDLSGEGPKAGGRALRVGPRQKGLIRSRAENKGTNKEEGGVTRGAQARA